MYKVTYYDYNVPHVHVYVVWFYADSVPDVLYRSFFREVGETILPHEPGGYGCDITIVDVSSSE